MTVDILLGHIEVVGKEKEKALREDHKEKITLIEKERLKLFEELKSLLEKELETERVLMIQHRVREENSKLKAEISLRKNELFKQIRKETRKMIFETEKEMIIEIFVARLRLIKDRLANDVKLISSEEHLSLAREVLKRVGIECPIETSNIADSELVLENKEMIIELSVEELIEKSIERNSAKLYAIIFDK